MDPQIPNQPIKQNHGDPSIPFLSLMGWFAIAVGAIYAIVALGNQDAPVMPILLVAFACASSGVLLVALAAVAKAIIAGTLAIQRIEELLHERDAK